MLTPRQLCRKQVIDICIDCKMASRIEGGSRGQKQSHQNDTAKMPNTKTDGFIYPRLQHARSLSPMTVKLDNCSTASALIVGVRPGGSALFFSELEWERR